VAKLSAENVIYHLLQAPIALNKKPKTITSISNVDIMTPKGI